MPGPVSAILISAMMPMRGRYVDLTQFHGRVGNGIHRVDDHVEDDLLELHGIALDMLIREGGFIGEPMERPSATALTKPIASRTVSFSSTSLISNGPFFNTLRSLRMTSMPGDRRA